MPYFSIVFAPLLPPWARKKAKKPQTQCSENPGAVQKGVDNSPESLNVLKNEPSSKESTPSICPQQASSNVCQTALAAEAPKSVKEVYPDTGGGQSSTFAPEDTTVIGASGKETLHHQENLSKGNDDTQGPTVLFGPDGQGTLANKVAELETDVASHSEQDVYSGNGMVERPAVDGSNPMSDLSEEEELKKAIALSLENGMGYDGTTGLMEDETDDELEKALALSLETPSSRLLPTDGLKRTEEPSSSKSRGQEELNTSQPSNGLVSPSITNAHGQPNINPLMTQLVNLCEDANTAATIHNVLFQGSPVSLTQFLLNLASHCLTLYKASGELRYIARSLDFMRAYEDNLRLANEAGRIDGHVAIHNVESETVHRQSGQSEDLDRTIGIFEKAIECVDHDDYDTKVVLLSILGRCLIRRFQRKGDLRNLDQAVKTQQQAVDLTPDKHTEKPSLLNNIGTSLRTRFQWLGDLGDLDQAVKAQQQAVDLTPDGHTEKPTRLNNIGTSLRTRFERFGNLADMDEAVKMHQQAVDLALDGHAEKPTLLNNLGISLRQRFERLGDLDDLDQAVKRQQQAVDLTPDGHPSKPSRLNSLGVALHRRYERLGNLDDLDQAVKTQQTAINHTPDGHANKPNLLNNLGNCLQLRFDRLGDLDDLNEAVKTQQHAVDLAPDGHPKKPCLLNNLGNSLRIRFRRLGDLSDLDKAVKTQQHAVYLTQDGHAEKSSLLTSLGASFRTRFERLGDLGDLDQAVRVQQQAVDLTPDGHGSKPSWLNNLGNSLHTRFERSGNLGDLDQAVKTQQQSVDLTPAGHAEKSSRLNNLGTSFLRRFEQLGGLSDLDEAVKVQQESVSLTPDGHASKSSLLNNLGNCFRYRFERLGDLADLDEAVKAQQQAVDLAPDGHADKASLLTNLANSLQIRLSHRHTTQDRNLLISSLNIAATSSSSPPSVRFKAALKLTAILHPQLQPYQIAIDIVPQVVWLGRTIAQRYNDLEQLGELVMDAVAAACAQEEYDLALEWFEQGRAIIWGQILQLRSPMDKLQVDYPDLANELTRIASALEMAGTVSTVSSEGTPSAEDVAQEHRRLAKKWEDTLAIVRALPDFSDFLKPKTASVLKSTLTNRTIVLVNVSCHRSDALILLPVSGSSSISHAPLPNLSATKVNEARDKLIKTLRLSGVRIRDIDRGSLAQKKATPRTVSSDVPNILQMLWNDVSKPILDHLGYSTPQPIGTLPHITWCLTGALAILPLHAAGIYTSTGSDDKLFNYAVSSYTPSLTSLAESLERNLTTPSARRLLAITQEHTPNFTPLPATMTEVDQVKALMDKYNINVTRIDGVQATVKTVSDTMNDHSWIHLACHGMQHATEPTKSAFSLHDGPLELVNIMRKPLTRAELAYLSACQTASGHAALPNEAIHLAAGMFTAGYGTVVATLWSIRDADAPTVAQEFYDRLLSNPDSGAARALHEAVRVLREHVGEENLLAWVPYIHIGS